MTIFDDNSADACPDCGCEVVWFIPTQQIDGSWERSGHCRCPDDKQPKSDEEFEEGMVGRPTSNLIELRGRRAFPRHRTNEPGESA